MDIDNPLSDPRPPQLRRGTNQAGIRLYNERLVLSLVRHAGALPKADIARQTGLSPPTVQVIVQQLEADGLLIRREAQRGRVGQPSIPLSLNPDGAFSFGLKIGRRSADLVLMDFVGGLRGALHRTYPYPNPRSIVSFVAEGCRTLSAQLPDESRSRIAGLGIATPFELWNWEEEVGAPRDAMQVWRDFDLQGEVETVVDAPVYVCNDATGACAAELLFGRAARHLDVVYVFVAWFIGGGVVLNGNLFPGRSGYAGSLGQVLVPAVSQGERPAARQLLHCASLYVLARRVAAAGADAAPIWESPDDWTSLERYVEPWLDEAAEGIAHAVVSSVAVAEFQTAVIDGAFPGAIRRRLVERIREKIDKLERKGLPSFAVVEGSIGSSARAVGGASLPFLAKFMRDRELLFQEPGDNRARPAEPVHQSRTSPS